METLKIAILAFMLVYVAAGAWLLHYHNRIFRQWTKEYLDNERDFSKKMLSDIKELRSMIKLYKKTMK